MARATELRPGPRPVTALSAGLVAGLGGAPFQQLPLGFPDVLDHLRALAHRTLRAMHRPHHGHRRSLNCTAQEPR
ncbi:hypothetical protein [Streptomyces chattanoogensis]|uniref:hypothetical protein n=1 Tax=Streptomyces chattanoogensis TaxID=66876 RepID=UPI000A4A3382|nr:hypothetical protein [Streptomyces chattanoogensis]